MRPILKNTKLRAAFGTSIALLVLGYAVSLVALKDVENLLIIHFDSFRGIDFLGAKINVFEILSVGMFFVVLNILLAWGFFEKRKFFSYILGYMSIVISSLILIAVGVILSVNL